MFAALRFPGSELKELADERAGEAQRLSAAALRALPPYEAETIPRRGVAVTLTTYREDAADGDVRIVVVATVRRSRFLAWGTSAAAGFAVDVEGRIRELSEEEWWQYS